MTYREAALRSVEARRANGTLKFADPSAAVKARWIKVCVCGHEARDHHDRGRGFCLECETCEEFTEKVAHEV